MDLLAPCRSCLQCLPFFQLSSPRPRLAAAEPSSPSPHSPDASKASSIDPAQSSENLPSPPAAPAVQEQDVCPPIKVEEETQDAKCDRDETSQHSEDEHSTVPESEAVPASGIVIAPPVSSPPTGAYFPEDADDIKDTTLPEKLLQVPFINDITFSASGFLPVQSPITPAPFGPGYPAGQYPHHDQIRHDPHAHLHHKPENPQHGDENSRHGHDSVHHEHPISHHEHEHAHHGHADSHDGDASQHSCLDGDHDKIDDISPTPLLEVSQSTPNLDAEVTVGGENIAASHTNGESALLESYHSEPVVVPEDPDDDDNEGPIELLGHSGLRPPSRGRRRDHFRNHLKGIKQQIKQGGLHFKEEGSKHMQTIIENMNKQAQQIEQSGSFFMVPRSNNN